MGTAPDFQATRWVAPRFPIPLSMPKCPCGRIEQWLSLKRAEPRCANEPCPKRVMICYVVSFCLRHQLAPPYACGVFAYATHLEVLLTPPASATLRAWSFSSGRYDTTLTKYVHGGFGRCSNGYGTHCGVSVFWTTIPK